MDNVMSFLAQRLGDDEAQAARMEKIASSDAWVGIDPVEVAATIRRTVHGGRYVLELHSDGKVSELHVRLLALAYGNHPDYREAWKPDLS